MEGTKLKQECLVEKAKQKLLDDAMAELLRILKEEMSKDIWNIPGTQRSYSGVDIRQAVDQEIIGVLTEFSESIQREVTPIYSIGNLEPVGFWQAFETKS